VSHVDGTAVRTSVLKKYHLLMMRNRTSLPGIDIEDMVYYPIKGISYGAKFDWDEVWGGIVTCPKCGEDDPDLWSWGTDSKTIKDVPIGLAPI
jgi:hypothetical protein